MLNKLFGKPKAGTAGGGAGRSAGSSVSGSSNGDTLNTLAKLQETIEMLEKRQALLERKVADEHNRAKEFTKQKNKKAALMCLKRKKLYEQQVETLANNTLRIQDQIITLEGAKATTETVKAMREGAATMKHMQNQMSISSVDDVMDEIQEQTDNMKQIQDALSAPVGALADLDEDDLDAELAELEDEDLMLEEGPVGVATSVPSQQVQQQQQQQSSDPFNLDLPAVPSSKVQQMPSVPTNTKTAEELELEALQAEMAL